jgi:hypothetical protein
MEFYETQEMTGSQIRRFTIENRIMMTANQKKAARLYGLCCVCWEQTYCPHKGAGIQRCKDFYPSNLYHK